MAKFRPPKSVELVTVGILPLQYFVSRAILKPPGTPARPRPDRPPFVNDTQPPEKPSVQEPAALAKSKDTAAFSPLSFPRRTEDREKRNASPPVIVGSCWLATGAVENPKKRRKSAVLQNQQK